MCTYVLTKNDKKSEAAVISCYELPVAGRIIIVPLPGAQMPVPASLFWKVVYYSTKMKQPCWL